MDDELLDETEGSGAVTFASRRRDDGEPPADLFDEEERPPKRLVLVVMVPEDAPELVAALEADGVGARLGEQTEDGGVEILVHDTKLPAAQAVLVEFTGDPSLVDAVVEAEDQPSEERDDDLVAVTSGGLTGMSSQLERLRAAGIDVRVEMDEDADPLLATGSLLVHADDLERARRVLGIAV
jgi:hypothetical protein